VAGGGHGLPQGVLHLEFALSSKCAARPDQQTARVQRFAWTFLQEVLMAGEE